MTALRSEPRFRRRPVRRHGGAAVRRRRGRSTGGRRGCSWPSISAARSSLMLVSGEARSGAARAAHEGRAVGRGATGAEDHHDHRLAGLRRPRGDPAPSTAASAGRTSAGSSRSIGNALVLLGGYGVWRVFRENSFTSARIELARDQRVDLDRPLCLRAPSDVCDGAGDDGRHPDRARLAGGGCLRSRR